MSRCNSRDELNVHHKRRDGGNGIENARVLCHNCHVNTSTFGREGKKPPEFSQEVKETALIHAAYRCECEKEECHFSPKEIDHIIDEAVKMPKYHL